MNDSQFIPINPKDGLQLNCSWATLSLVLILICTLCNGFFDSVRSDFGADHRWERTFLYTPPEGGVDVEADLIEPALAFPPFPQLDTTAWPPIFQSYYQHNSYGGVDAIPERKSTTLHLPPATLLIMLTVKRGILLVGPSAVVALYYALVLACLWIMCRFFTLDFAHHLFFFTVILCSYPVLAILTRGNLEAFLIGMVLIFFIYLACTGQHGILAAILLGLAADLHPNTLLLAPLLLAFGIRRTLILGAISASFILLSSALAFVIARYAIPDYSLALAIQSLHHYTELYIIGSDGDAYNSSLYGAVKAVLHRAGYILGNSWLMNANSSIFLGCLLALGYNCHLFLTRRLLVFEFAFLTMAFYVMSSTVFTFYHLLIFFVFALATEKIPTLNQRPSRALLFLSAIVLIPKNYFFLKANVSIEVFLNPLILLAATLWLISRALRRGKPDRAAVP